MSRFHGVKDLIYRRLAATVEEVMGLLERTLTEYEEELRTAGQLLDSTAEVKQLVIKAEVSPEQLKCRTSLEPEEPEEPEHPHIRTEEQYHWTRVGGEQQRGVTHIPVTHDFMKNGAEEEAQSTQHHEGQTAENMEAEPPASSSAQQIKTERGGGKSEPDRISASGFKCLSGSRDEPPHSSDAETEDSSDHQNEIRRPQTDLKAAKTQLSVNDVRHHEFFSCSRCGKRFHLKHRLQAHMRCHTGEKPFVCSVCGKRFTSKGNMTQHLTIHTREKPCNCPVCGERFAQQGNLTQHMTVHKREKFRSKVN